MPSRISKRVKRLRCAQALALLGASVTSACLAQAVHFEGLTHWPFDPPQVVFAKSAAKESFSLPSYMEAKPDEAKPRRQWGSPSRATESDDSYSDDEEDSYGPYHWRGLIWQTVEFNVVETAVRV